MNNTYFNYIKQILVDNNYINNREKFSKDFNRNLVSGLIKEILKNKQLLHNISNNSYRHNNGFNKIVLFQNDKLSLRLHIWDNILKNTFFEKIHDHRWNFVSHMLIGALKYQEYQLSENGDIYNHYIYKKNIENKSFHLKYIGKQKLIKTFETTFSHDINYYLNEKSYHRIIGIPKIYTSTIMLHDKINPTNVDLFTKDNLNIEKEHNIKYFTPKELSTILQKFIIHIDKDSDISQLDDKEMLTIVDDQDNIIGSLPRWFVYQKSLKNFRVVNAFIENEKGELWTLIRSPKKKFFPLGLDLSVGGHVTYGETYEDALKRELLEEVSLNLDDLNYILLGHLNPYEVDISSFSKTYKIFCKKEKLEFNKDEFVDGFWLSPKEIMRKINSGAHCKSDLPKLLKLFYKDKI